MDSILMRRARGDAPDDGGGRYRFDEGSSRSDRCVSDSPWSRAAANRIAALSIDTPWISELPVTNTARPPASSTRAVSARTISMSPVNRRTMLWNPGGRAAASPRSRGRASMRVTVVVEWTVPSPPPHWKSGTAQIPKRRSEPDLSQAVPPDIVNRVETRRRRRIGLPQPRALGWGRLLRVRLPDELAWAGRGQRRQSDDATGPRCASGRAVLKE